MTMGLILASGTLVSLFSKLYSRAAGGNTASGLPLGSTLTSLLNATGGILSDNNGSVLKLASLLGGADNSTSLSSLGLGRLNLNVSALLQDPSCPGGGLLNPSLNLGNTCVGAQVLTSDNIANLCVQQAGGCCCSPGKSLNLSAERNSEPFNSTFHFQVMNHRPSSVAI
jgi:hypothetical protein